MLTTAYLHFKPEGNRESREEVGFLSPVKDALKGHKYTFLNFLKFRLINPSKSEIAKINKLILDKINNALVETT